MKLFLLIPYIASLINVNTASNQTYNNQTALPNIASLIQVNKTSNQTYNNQTALPNIASLIQVNTTLNQTYNNQTALPNIASLIQVNKTSNQTYNNQTALPNIVGLIQVNKTSNQTYNNQTALPNIASLIQVNKTSNQTYNNQTALPNIASLIQVNTTLNQTYNNHTALPNSSSIINNLKQCYQCDFPIEDFTNASRLFNDNCINKTVNCNNNFCSSSLVKNKFNGKYTMKLGCISKNYCPEVIDEDTKYPEKIANNYINCCDSNLCNNYTTINDILPFYLEDNTSPINDTAPLNQTINTQEAISNLVHDFYFSDDYLNKSCIDETIFTNKNNLIVTFKKDSCSKTPVALLAEDSLPAFPSQPLVKIVLLDSKTKNIHNLVSSDTFITNVNYISSKSLLLFIADNNVFVYKLDENNHQLQKISQLYLNYNYVDMKVNYNGDLLLISSKTMVYFYKITNIEETKEFINITKSIPGDNIYKVTAAPNRNIFLVESYNKNNIYINFYSLAKNNEIKHIGYSKKRKRDIYEINLENIRYNPYKLSFYYGKLAISPVSNFAIYHHILTAFLKSGCPPRYNYDGRELHKDFAKKTTYRDGWLCSHLWNDKDKANKNQFNGCANAWYYPVRANKMILDYFFNTDKKPILAFILVTKNNDIHLVLQKTGSISRQWSLGLELATSKRILDNAYGGVFNNGSSKVAVFSNNRIQVYTINLYRNK